MTTRTQRNLRPPVVCLLSANPLALPELRRMLPGRGLRIQVKQFDLTSGADLHEIPVPRASAYVLDTFSTGAVTEGIIAGIRARHHNARIVAIVDGLTDVQGLSLLRLGVKGMVRHRQASHLPSAVKAVARGGMWVPRHLISKFLDSVLGRGQPRPLPQRLSPRERQVLDAVVKNLSNKEISVHLNISESTVKFHLAHLFDKFGVRRRADLIIQSVQEPAALIH